MSLGDLTKLLAIVLCLGEPPGGFCDVGCCCCCFAHWKFVRFWATFPCHRHSSATVLSRPFLPTGVFYLTLFLHIFDTFCDSDVDRNTPSRILLCACPRRVVPSGWLMDLNHSYCSYKTIDLSIAPVSHRV